MATLSATAIQRYGEEREVPPDPQQTGARLCPRCGASESVAPNEPLWPAGWSCAVCGEAVPVVDGIPHYAWSLADTLTGFDPAAFRVLAERERGHFWFEPRNRLLLALAQRYFPGAERYLEIGCGTGFVLSAFAQMRPWARLVGSEMHPAGLLFARQRLGDRAEFVQMDARMIPASGAFDLIGAFDVLEHISEDETVVANVFSALAHGGGFIAAVPQHPFLWSEADERGSHVRRYRRGELEAKLRAAGFEILFSNSYNATLLPVMILNRLARRRRARPQQEQPSPEQELDLPRPVNSIFRSILETEVTLTLKGMSWPAGGSRIVVVRKPET
jgi:SAM-dependent methyltransferase